MRLVFLVLALTCATGRVLAVESCELNGQYVSPANGNTTAGKTGPMRCRDGEGGPTVREQELKNGVFTGVVRTFRDGQLEREQRVSERGNREGVAREYAVSSGKSVLVREETYREGRSVGLVRSWYPSGQLRRVGFHDDEGRELAYAEFTEQGKLYELRCASSERRGGAQPTRVHRNWDDAGHLRGERFYDERGRVTRERELDASSAVVRDDEVFEDGSRKTFGR